MNRQLNHLTPSITQHLTTDLHFRSVDRAVIFFITCHMNYQSQASIKTEVVDKLRACTGFQVHNVGSARRGASLLA